MRLNRLIKKNLKTLSLFYGPAVLLLAALSIQDKVPLSFLTRDPAQITNQPFYMGFMSSLGIICWSASASVALLAAVLVYRVDDRKLYARFLFVSGLLSLGLMADDWLLIHERLGPENLHIPQPVIAGAYAVIFAGYLVIFRRVIAETDYMFLLFAFGFLGLSLVVDTLGDVNSEMKSLAMEDGPKFLGIVSWLAYFTVTALQQVEQSRNVPVDHVVCQH